MYQPAQERVNPLLYQSSNTQNLQQTLASSVNASLQIDRKPISVAASLNTSQTSLPLYQSSKPAQIRPNTQQINQVLNASARSSRPPSAQKMQRAAELPTGASAPQRGTLDIQTIEKEIRLFGQMLENEKSMRAIPASGNRTGSVQRGASPQLNRDATKDLPNEKYFNNYQVPQYISQVASEMPLQQTVVNSGAELPSSRPADAVRRSNPLLPQYEQFAQQQGKYNTSDSRYSMHGLAEEKELSLDEPIDPQWGGSYVGDYQQNPMKPNDSIAYASRPFATQTTAQRNRPSSAQPKRPSSSLGLLSSGISVAPSSAADSPFMVHRRASVSGDISSGWRPASARESRFSVDKVRQELEEKHRQECTFRPKITKFASSKFGSPSITKQRMEQLAQPKARDYEQRQLEKQQREEEHLRRFSFRPKTNQSSENTRINPLRASERLSKEAERRAESRERAKREQEMRIMQQCQFRPKTNRSGSVDLSQHRPIHERVGEIRRRKHETIQQLQMQMLQQPDNRFVPRINKVSAKMAKARFNDSAHTERLAQQLAREKDRKERIQEEYEAKLTKECTFRPEISKNTKKIAQQSTLFGSSSQSSGIDAFLQRQVAYDAREKSRRQVEETNQSHYSFKPVISQTSQLLVESKPERAGESEQDKLQRLAFKDKQKTQALKETIVDEYYSQYSFRPKINEISKALGPSPSCDTLVSLDRKEKALEAAREKARQEFNQKYTFKPKLLTDPSLAEESQYRLGVKDPAKLVNKFEEMRREREQKIARTKKAQQYEELNGCTFQPHLPGKVSLNSSIGKQTQAVVVRGLEMHMSRVELAQKKKEERERREAEVFGSKATIASGNPLGYTIPEPFNLSRNSLVAEMRQKELQQKWNRYDHMDCTFAPRTNFVSASLVSDLL